MTRRYLLLQALLIAAVTAGILVAYPHLPARIVTHWNASMQPNGHGPRWMLFVLGPGLMGTILLLTALLPWLSPKQFEVDGFRSTYLRVMLLVQLLLGFIVAMMVWADTGHRMDLGRAVTGGICLTFVLLGNVMGKIRRNFFIGVRTPWTLSSERVWYATHRFAAKTFVACGLVGLVMVLTGPRRGPVAALLLAVLAPVVYSLVLYKRLEGRGEL
jgi:immunity protein, SdpI family